MPAEVGVVVPTHGRPEALRAVLAGLAAQTLDPSRFEVVVVDDGSQPPARAPGASRVVRHDRARGPAAARNAGWRATSAPLVAFVDDDCVPEPGWLAALLEAAVGDEDVVVQGAVRPAQGPRTPLTHTVEVAGPSRLLVSANVAASRALLERLGGFDESFRRACGEDVELGARASRAGARWRWAPDAVVVHELRQGTLAGALRQTSKWTDSVRVVAMHPELRDLLVARVFWKPTHPLLLLALAGVALRRPWLALAWAAHHARGHGGRPAELLRWLPVHLVLDGWEVGVAVAGSVRHRTLFL